MESVRTQPRNVTMIPPTMRMHTSAPLSQTAIRRVAGYARVSTDNEEQQTSYEAQMDYYKRFISEHDGWRYIGLYSDADAPYGQIPNLHNSLI